MNGPGDFQIGKAVPLSPWSTESLRDFVWDTAREATTAIGAPGSYHPPCVDLKAAQPAPERDLSHLFAWSGDLFSATEALHPTGFFMNEGANTFHFQVWRAYEGIDSRFHGFVTSFPSVNPQLVFNDPEHALAFNAWFVRYVRFYGDDCSTELPELPVHKRLTVTPIVRTVYATPEEIVDDWAWMTQTLKGGIWFTETHILFEREEEVEAYLDHQKRTW